MSDSYTNNQTSRSDFQNQRQPSRNNLRGGRGPNNRESGFRIRLSDNEMRAARSLQETFNLRSTVAVLGFALRTLAQMLEDGNLDDLVNQYKSQSPSNDQRRARGDKSSSFNNKNDNNIKTKPNPFARPEKPSKETEQETSPSSKSNEISEASEEDNNNQDSDEISNEVDPSKTSEQE